MKYKQHDGSYLQEAMLNEEEMFILNQYRNGQYIQVFATVESKQKAKKLVSELPGGESITKNAVTGSFNNFTTKGNKIISINARIKKVTPPASKE